MGAGTCEDVKSPDLENVRMAIFVKVGYSDLVLGVVTRTGLVRQLMNLMGLGHVRDDILVQR